jgi:alpha-1,2-mannosyltransferase
MDIDWKRFAAAPWILGGMVVLFFYALDFQSTRNGVIGEAEIWGRDFINMWTGGKLIVARDFATLYAPDRFMGFQESLYGPLDRHIFSYPPVTFPLADLLSRLPYFVALALWLGGTGALFVHAARPFWPAGGSWAVLAVLTPAALLNIWEGHYGFLIGALFLYGFRWLDKKPSAAGVAIGLLIIKPQFALLIPLVLLLQWRWRTVVSAGVTVAAMIAMSVLVYGTAAWTEFLAKGAGRQAVIDAGGAFFGKLSTSAATAVLGVGGGWPLAIAVQVALGGLALALVVLAVRKRVATRDLALLVATCTFLVLPYGLNYDLTVVAIGAWAVMTSDRAAPTDKLLAALAFVVPTVGIITALAGAPITPLALAGLAFAQFRTATGRGGPAGEAATHSAL